MFAGHGRPNAAAAVPRALHRLPPAPPLALPAHGICRHGWPVGGPPRRPCGKSLRGHGSRDAGADHGVARRPPGRLRSGRTGAVASHRQRRRLGLHRRPVHEAGGGQRGCPAPGHSAARDVGGARRCPRALRRAAHRRGPALHERPRGPAPLQRNAGPPGGGPGGAPGRERSGAAAGPAAPGGLAEAPRRPLRRGPPEGRREAPEGWSMPRRPDRREVALQVHLRGVQRGAGVPARARALHRRRRGRIRGPRLHPRPRLSGSGRTVQRDRRAPAACRKRGGDARRVEAHAGARPHVR
mmetsp:Transcript_39128/g.116897  ORF Transcript_39128/g.116897 Transcript_39128/m.116897 type:complete len:297 (+) Transcript_39128:296-1186(+)